MDEYKKYDDLKEKIDRLKLKELGINSGERELFYSLYEELQYFKEKESIGVTLTESELGEKKGHMEDIDHWIEKLIGKQKETIQTGIDSFEAHLKEIIRKFEEVKAMFALENIVLEDVNQIVQGIEEDFRNLLGEANGLLSQLDEFKELAKGYTEGLDFNATYADIKSKLNKLKELLKEIKKDQIAKYNANVISTNEAIEKMKNELANDESLSDEVKEALAKLQPLEQCSYSTTGMAWNNRKYLEYLNYAKLKEMLLLLNLIGSKTRSVPVPPIDELGLEADMKYIEDRLVEIEGNIKDGMTMAEIKPLLDDLSHVSGKITEFEVKLKENKDKITEEKYNEYLRRIEAARNKLEELRKKLFERIPDLSKAFSEDLDSLYKDIEHLDFYVSSLFGKVTQEGVSVFEDRLVAYEARLNEIINDIEKAKKDGLLDENQYGELQKKITEIENKLGKIRGNIKDPKIVADIEQMDVFSFLNGQIDGIENAIDALEAQISSLDKPIKDRKVRKEIDKKFISIEQEIKDVQKFLDKYKDQDPDKYEAACERLNNMSDRLNKLGKYYRSKCPLLVRIVKNGKEFYKKHKKACLIVAGLAAVALVHATVGPVIIPAIMHGNIAIGAAVPALSGFTSFVNNILGGMINAVPKLGGAAWTLASGAVIGPTMNAAGVVSTSLLQGLAISGLGTAALLTPLIAGTVMGVKKLNQKMKTKESKFNFKEKFNEVKEKVGQKKDERKQNRDRTRYEKDSLSEMKTLLKDFNESGLDFEEFCELNKLSDGKKAILGYMLEEIERKKQEETQGKGRK